MGEASASELNPEPIKDLKGDAWAECYLLVLDPFPTILHFALNARRAKRGIHASNSF